jgi:formylglycine-generating enzyme required for sulfatase activity
MKTNTSLISSVFLGTFWLLLVMPMQAQVLDMDSTTAPVHLRAWARVTNSPSDQTIPQVVNDRLNEFHHNNHFRTAIPVVNPNDTTTIWFDTTGLGIRQAGVAHSSMRMKDFVFFNPTEYFTDPLKVEIEIFTETGINRWRRHRYLPRVIVTPPPIPYALRFYLDTTHIRAVPGQTRLYLSDKANLLPEPFLKPFWFRKYLVSNGEYREFVRYVTDSIARTILFNAGQKQYGRLVTRLDAQGKETKVLLLDYAHPVYWDEEQTENLEVLYLPDHERHYRRRQINSTLLNYESPTFCPPMAPLNIYPDTSAWIRDFPEGYMVPWERNYFWHPAYEHYPVVGINYWQALAFLDWKARQLQQELDQKGIRIRVVCDLPTEAEWEMVATADHVDSKPELYPRHYHELADQSWITNLQLTQDKIVQIDSTDKTLWQVHHRSNQLTEALEGSGRTRVRRQLDESIVAHPTGQYEKKKTWIKSPSPLYSPDQNGIFHMGSNVSEWLKDSYQEQWLPVFTKRQEMLGSFSDPEMVLLSQLEQYYNTLNDTNGRLVRGANWYDRRYSMLYGKNYSGMQAKRFVSPNNAHPTLGFRYIIRFEEY